jgi:polyisoprenoid-binding protein YceI
MKKALYGLAAGLTLLSTPALTLADNYVIDTKGMHAFVQFRVKHLGYSWLYGRFNDFSGNFSYDPAKPEASKINITINMDSVDSNHAERDKHIRSGDFLNTKKYPEAKFVSTSFTPTGDKTAKLNGNLSWNGTTRPITIDVETIGGGKDPWGGYRQGFEGRTTLKPADFGFDIAKKLGPAAGEVEMMLTIEGVRQ